MKKILTIIMVIIAACVMNSAQAYAPVIFNYEGIARASNGFPVANEAMNLRISIIERDADKRVVYQEIQKVQTNAMGLFHTSIGRGYIQQGSMGYFAGGKSLKYVQIELVSIGESAGFVDFECIKCRMNGVQ